MSEVKLAKDLQQELYKQLDALESSTDLEGTALVTKTGVRIVSASAATTDIDAHSASPATLVSLGEKIAEGLSFGPLKQIVIAGKEGYTIITTREDSNFMLLSHSKKAAKLGYYFHRLQKAFLKLVNMLKDIEITAATY